MHFEFFCFCPCKNTFPVSGPYEFPESSLVLAFSLKKKKKNKVPFGKPQSVSQLTKTKPQTFRPLPTKRPYISKKHIPPKILLHFALLLCYFLRQKLLYFALLTLLHYASKVITFFVIITFCGKSYYILRQLLHCGLTRCFAVTFK